MRCIYGDLGMRMHGMNDMLRCWQVKFGKIRHAYKKQQIKNYLKNKNTPFAKTMKSSKQVTTKGPLFSYQINVNLPSENESLKFTLDSCIV